MNAPDLHTGPGDRDNTLLVVLIALLSLPVAGIVWVWLRRSQLDLGLAIRRTARAVHEDPLVLAMVTGLFFLLATCAVWLWRDARERGVGVAGRCAWLVPLFLLGPLGLWMYVAARPPRDAAA